MTDWFISTNSKIFSVIFIVIIAKLPLIVHGISIQSDQLQLDGRQKYLKLRDELENLLYDKREPTIPETHDSIINTPQDISGFNHKRYIEKDVKFNSLGKGSDNEASLKALDDSIEYQNEWLVHINGSEELVQSLVEDLGYKYHGQVQGFTSIYYISRDHNRQKREVNMNNISIKEEDISSKVFWAEQQYVKERTKRGTYMQAYDDLIKEQYSEAELEANEVAKHRVKRKSRNKKQSQKYKVAELEKSRSMMDPRITEHYFNDELWVHQWYLFDSRTRSDLPKIDLEVMSAWKAGYTGKGVKVIVLDDGLEGAHSDLMHSYDASISYDVNDDDSDPTPKYDKYSSNSHGTMCAGEIVMEPNNTKCGVGVAYGATIGGVRMLDGRVNDRIEGASLAWGMKHGDVVTCSWGPMDDGRRVEGPGKLTQKALEEGILKGRNGLGSIVVWASGNGGHEQDNCNCDGYTSSMYTLSIGSASEAGESPWYGEACASTLATAYSSGAYTDQKIVTTDLHDSCTTKFAGTSAAAPLAAGIIALTLEANPALTWRDVQHLVARTSDWQPLSHDEGWQTNGRGLTFNSKFGFGVLNARKLVNVARNWKTVGKHLSSSFQPKDLSKSSFKSSESVTFEFEVSSMVEQVEHVQVIASIAHSKRGSLRVKLTSPSGTTTELLRPRKNDVSEDGFVDWPFVSVHTWGEDPTGTWYFTVEDTSDTSEEGEVKSLTMTIFGTSDPWQ